ncbi:LIMA1 family protein [Megaselia abdita]
MEVVEEKRTVTEEKCSSTSVTVEKKKTKKSKTTKNSMKKSFSKFDALQKKPENEQSEQKICQVCEKPVYKMEEILIKKKISFHRNCFKCVECRKNLTTDFFQSEEGILYCGVHWKKKFEKRIDDGEEKENGTPTLRKTEVIIRESNPVPLPPDVVRSSEKSSLGLEDLEKRNNRNIRSRFENGWTEKMAKMEEDEDDSEFENDENDLGDNESRKPKFSQMTEFREKFENGTKEDLKEERRESRKMELQNIRSRLFFGKQARIKEMYQQAVKDSSESTKKEIPEEDLKEITENTKVKKSMFENGEIFRKSKIERTDSCDIEVIENGLGKKSRNLFKEMEVENISKDVSSFTKNQKVTTPKKEVEEKETEEKKPDIVRSSRSPSPEFSSKNVSSAYEFFSTLSTKKENTEDKRRKEIGIGKSQTTTKMLSRFREMEQKKSDDEREIKPLKEFTPERDGGGRRYRQSDSDSEEDSESEENEGDMEREEDQCLVEARQLARARHLREKFEKWDNSEVSFERERENENIESSPLESTKSIRERFEHFGENKSLEEKRIKHKITRFV